MLYIEDIKYYIVIFHFYLMEMKKTENYTVKNFDDLKQLDIDDIKDFNMKMLGKELDLGKIWGFDMNKDEETRIGGNVDVEALIVRKEFGLNEKDELSPEAKYVLAELKKVVVRDGLDDYKYAINNLKQLGEKGKLNVKIQPGQNTKPVTKEEPEKKNETKSPTTTQTQPEKKNNEQPKQNEPKSPTQPEPKKSEPKKEEPKSTSPTQPEKKKEEPKPTQPAEEPKPTQPVEEPKKSAFALFFERLFAKFRSKSDDSSEKQTETFDSSNKDDIALIILVILIVVITISVSIYSVIKRYIKERNQLQNGYNSLPSTYY